MTDHHAVRRPYGRGRQALSRALALLVTSASLIAGGVLWAAPSFAANGYATTTAINVRSGPGTGSSRIGSEPAGATFTLLCQWQGGTNIGGNATWDDVTFSDGLTGDITDYDTTTPSFNWYAPNVGPCPGGVQVGRTVSTNRGVAGQCTWWAYNEFHAYSGLYPDIDGNADNWASSAAAYGWTVTSAPRVDSIAVFPPGVNGASADGHVAWVTNVSGGGIITISEMNGPVGPGNVDTRTLTPASSVRYILAP